MIKAIKKHLAPCSLTQTELESQLTEPLSHRTQLNRTAFQAYMPNLAVVFEENIIDDLGLFCNKKGHLNLASQNSGQVIYGLDPKAESEQDIADFLQGAAHIKLNGTPVKQVPLLRAYQMPESKGFVPALPLSPVPAQADTVVMLGLGLGHALEALLRSPQVQPQNILVYEPTLDFFRASAQVADWHFILETAQERGIRLFLQIGQTGEQIGQDLLELQQAFKAQDVYLYKHYHDPIMDAVYDTLVQPGFNLKALAYGEQSIQPLSHVTQYLIPRAGKVRSNIKREQAALRMAELKSLKEKNLAAFAQEFPDIYEQFKDYQPVQWQAFLDDHGEVNLYHEQRLGALYHERPNELCQQTLQLFADEPNRNDMFTGYRGGKLWSYLHFAKARQFGALLTELEEKGHFIPKTLSSLIWFGLELGYQLQELVSQYDIKSLYIFEPNPDFFYWSLMTVPWHEILPAQREAGLHLAINIGDDGTYLHQDMFEMYQSSGGYLTASSYFYVPRFTPHMQPHINQLKRDLQSYLMLGDNFDHNRYAFRNIEQNIQRGRMRILKYEGRVAEDLAQMPVVLVGNGPSLDSNLQLLKQRRDEFIVVSCGTALKALYVAGIQPDFHAEVEQNRATYHWITQVNDLAWLKQITLLSLTATHPDSVDLFKEHFAVFKQGEASTSAVLRRSKLERELAAVDFCYPTVTNLALSIAVTLGFKNIYLLGVDLGFKDMDHHHSKSSAYYKKGEEKSWHNFRKSAGEAIAVRGNFSPVVLTKYEFQLSRRIMEQLLSEQAQRVQADAGMQASQVFNCSDGAYIQGTEPSPFEQVSAYPKADREALLTHLRTQLFTDEHREAMLEVYRRGFDNQRMQEEAENMLALAKRPVHSIDEALTRLEDEKNNILALHKEGKSLWFYLIFGSSHFASACLVRFLFLDGDEEKALDNFRKANEIWISYLQEAIDSWLENPHKLDEISVKF
ncbi:hypothetical protein CWE15_06405 [Aliidiomarina taiwanensis]|uniref:DUF115 domain-containing protein n=1 Tax=Aliidiomarina taiwanensis TaxID=946228 RepID=A0A432X829_9GAMM|nr:6-hydroxymethylpterin diphosphokinase MptE-like protein [Aliidiomarina taiwanensis]RUO43029.1 hypothetical protein CWE15_06405 [Aliidiomarina taiwanensis]